MLRRVLARLRLSGRDEPVEATVAEMDVIPDHESVVRRMVAEAHGDRYEAIKSLDEAKATADAAVVMEGDYGGSIYLTCPARLVHCDEPTLRQLLRDLDKHDWNDPEGVGLSTTRSHLSARESPAEPAVVPSPTAFGSIPIWRRKASGSESRPS